jgi:dATP pyrophosphohydrolase
VPVFRSTHVEVYPFRRRGSRAEFLLLRRAAGRPLPGVWQPVTGRRLARETPLSAAVRELSEETGLTPLRWWAVESISVYYDVQADAVLALPLFAAELAPGDVVRLSAEHDAFAWVSPAAARRRVLWEAQRRGLDAVQREVWNGGPLADALDVSQRVRSGRRRTGGSTSARMKARRQP